ncbi:hypothetical protein [Streptomyces bungoensis]|uniref:hypothetical protein n=1 Tax=Streptomyces bungoensis TaxID=285568 RepID=UPI0033F025DA
MAHTSKSRRHRSGAVLRTAVGSAPAVAVLALTLTACNADGDAAASPGGAHTAAAEPGAGTGGTAPGSTAAGTATSAKPVASKPAAKPVGGAGGAASPAPSATAAASAAPSPACDHKMPISPDEVAVYRYTPEGGSLSLIVRYGNWGCAPADSDGAPFVTVGKETYLPMDQAAYVTATNPVVESSENQHIGVQEFLDWLEAHPNSGLVFKYHLGADGAVDRLDEVFTP